MSSGQNMRSLIKKLFIICIIIQLSSLMFNSLCFQSVLASWFLSLLLFFFSCNYTNHRYNTCNYIHINILLQKKCNVHSTRYILLTLSTCNISEFDNKVIFQQIFNFFFIKGNLYFMSLTLSRVTYGQYWYRMLCLR